MYGLSQQWKWLLIARCDHCCKQVSTTSDVWCNMASAGSDIAHVCVQLCAERKCCQISVKQRTFSQSDTCPAGKRPKQGCKCTGMTACMGPNSKESLCNVCAPSCLGALYSTCVAGHLHPFTETRTVTRTCTVHDAVCRSKAMRWKMCTLYRASRQPSNALMSDPSRPCTQAVMSSGQSLRVPKPTMTAMLVPTVCRSGLDGFRMQCSKDSCNSTSACQAIVT